MKIVLLVLLGLSVGWQANADESYGIFESSDQGETWRIFDQSLNFAGEVEDDCSTPGAAATDASESSLPDEIRLPVANPGSNTTQQTFLRFTNPNNTSTSVELYGIDDDGVLSQKVLNFSLAPNASRQITSQDIENGNASKALTGNICDGRGKWQFRIRCDNEIKVMSLIRTPDGFLTSLNDVVPKVGDDNVVYFANPASNTQQQTFLRVVNLSSESDSVTISAIDDNGTSASGSVSFTLAANESKQMTSQDLENGNISKGLIGSLGDGEGKWQLTVTSVLNLEVMSLIRTQDGFQTNLSGMVDENDAGDHVIYFANPASESVKTTFLRIVNTTDQTGTVTISGVDDNGQSAPGGPVTFTLSPNASKHMTTGDLETGNTGKGLNGMLGDGIGRWQLTVSADVAIRVMSLVRTPDGFLTNMSRTTPVSNGVNEVFIFNPGSNQNQQSMLRIVNTEEVQSRVTISGVDDDGNEAPGGDVIFNLASRAGIVLSAQDLEGGNGGLGLEGALGDGVGKWHLQVSSETDLKVQSLLNTSSGFLTNLSRTVDDSINVLTYYKSSISQPIVQTRCIVCHIVGGVATGSAIRFATTSESGYQDSNYQVLHDYVAGVEGQADTIRDKVRGVAHVGGVQLVEGGTDYQNLDEFLGLLVTASSPEAAPVAALENPVQGCLGCHAPTDSNAGIEVAHRNPLLTCTNCHGGDPDGIDIISAHIATPDGIANAAAARRLTSVELDALDVDYIRWINPSDYRVVDQTCGQSDCHAEIARAAPSSIMTTFAGHFNKPFYSAGIQSERDAIFGVRDQTALIYEGEEGTSSEFQTLTTNVLTEDSEFGDFMGHYLDKGCPRCHVWNFGSNDLTGDYRSSGCAGCHMIYDNDGLSHSGDPTINKDDPAHPVSHELTSSIPDYQCEHCHYRGNRIGTMFRGLRESARLEEVPNRKVRMESLHGHVPGFYVEDDDVTNDYDETPPDVHFSRGLGCIDCHVGGDVHGDGRLYAAHDLQVGIVCTDCHGTAEQRAQPDAEGVYRNSAGYVLRHLEDRDNGPLLRSPTDGAAHFPPQLVNLADYKTSQNFIDSHQRNNEGFSHLDNLECYSCHSSWTQSCFGCHVTVDAREDGKSLINGEVTPGAIAGSRSWVVTDYLALGLNAEGRITPMAPQEKMYFTAIVPCEGGGDDCTEDAETDDPGKLVFDQKVRRTHDGKLGMGFGPIVPHTVSATSQPCDRCHLREDGSNEDIVNETIGRGSGRFQIPDGENVLYDLTKVLDENDDPTVGMAHSGSRVLSKDMIERILKPRVSNSGLVLRTVSDWVSASEISGPTPPTSHDTTTPGENNIIPAASCEEIAEEIPTLVIGAATPEFELLLNGSDLPVREGAQGGGAFLRLIARTLGIYPGSEELGSDSYPAISYELYVDGNQVLTDQQISSILRIRADGQRELPVHNVLVASLSASQLSGEQARLDIRLEDACGTLLVQSIGVTLSR